MRALVMTGILATTLLMSGCFHHGGHGYHGGYQAGHGGHDSHGSSVVHDEHGSTVVDEYGNVIASDHILVDDHD